MSIETASDATLEKFLACTDFVGGGLIEYVSGHKFRTEWGRANIVGVDTTKGLRFITDAQAYLSLSQTGIDLGFSVDILEDGCFALTIPWMYNYMIVPAKAMTEEFIK